jgi:hypothetical protein
LERRIPNLISRQSNGIESRTTAKFAMKSSELKGISRHRFLGLLLVWTILGLLSFSLGCASWGPTKWTPGIWSGLTDDSSRKESSTQSKLQHSSTSLSRQSREALLLAVEFRHVPTSLLDETTWSLIDETAIPAGIRQAWLRNGMRIGVIAARDDILSTPNNVDEDGPSSEAKPDPINAFLAGAEVMGKKSDGREVIPLRPAHRHELPLSPSLDGEQVVLVNRSAGLIGQQFDSPQLVLALKAQRGPRAGQVTLDIRPEIHHGAVKQQFISSDTAVRIHAGRERWDMHELDFTWTTRPGTTLMIAPAIGDGPGEPTFGLGNQMLRDDQHLEDDQHLIALIQLAR